MKKFPERSVATRATSALVSSSSIAVARFIATALLLDAVADCIEVLVPMDDIRQYLGRKQFPDSGHGFRLLLKLFNLKFRRSSAQTSPISTSSSSHS